MRPATASFRPERRAALRLPSANSTVAAMKGDASVSGRFNTMKSRFFRASFRSARAVPARASSAKPPTILRPFRRASPATMSGFRTRRSATGSRPRPSGFSNLPTTGRAGRKSATAAAITSPSDPSNARDSAAFISRALSTRTISTPFGGSSATGPETSVTS